MSPFRKTLNFVVVCFVLGGATGCETSDGGGSVSGSVYYGVGLYDPWYYGGYDDIDIDINPPDRPDRPPRPEQPIARPTPSPSPRPASIPSTPRAMPRSGGGRR